MNENLLMPQSKSAFNYTLFLDDVIQMTPSFQEDTSFNLEEELEFNGFDRKASFAECETQAMMGSASNDSDLESPIKVGHSKPAKTERLRKSDGCLPWGIYSKRNTNALDFLSDNSSDEQDMKGWSFNISEPVSNCETKSDIPGKNLSNFSLYSCFKNNLSHFGMNSFVQSKLNVDFPSKINGKKLKSMLKKKHFEIWF